MNSYNLHLNFGSRISNSNACLHLHYLTSNINSLKMKDYSPAQNSVTYETSLTLYQMYRYTACCLMTMPFLWRCSLDKKSRHDNPILMMCQNQKNTMRAGARGCNPIGNGCFWHVVINNYKLNEAIGHWRERKSTVRGDRIYQENYPPWKHVKDNVL